MTSTDADRPVAIVTGAGSGIGAASVALLIREGFRVAGFDRDGDAVARVLGGRTIPIIFHPRST